jgi:hypothetical protein
MQPPSRRERRGIAEKKKRLWNEEIFDGGVGIPLGVCLCEFGGSAVAFALVAKSNTRR